MKRILVSGATKLAYKWVKVLAAFHDMNILAIIDNRDYSYEQIQKLAHSLDIPIDHSFTNWMDKDVDFILETTGEQKIIRLLAEVKREDSVLIPKTFFELLFPLMNDWNEQISNLELILNNLRDGLIVVDSEKKIKFMNDTASEIIGISKDASAGQPIQQLIPNTRLPNVLQNQLKEVNQKRSEERRVGKKSRTRGIRKERKER